MSFTRQLLKAKAKGHEIVVAFGMGYRESMPTGMLRVAYAPRNASDPKPWAADGFRFTGRECQVEDRYIKVDLGEPRRQDDRVFVVRDLQGIEPDVPFSGRLAYREAEIHAIHLNRLFRVEVMA